MFSLFIRFVPVVPVVVVVVVVVAVAVAAATMHCRLGNSSLVSVVTVLSLGKVPQTPVPSMIPA